MLKPEPSFTIHQLMEAVSELTVTQAQAREYLIGICKKMSSAENDEERDRLLHVIENEIAYQSTLRRKLRKVGYSIEILNQFVGEYRN